MRCAFASDLEFIVWFFFGNFISKLIESWDLMPSGLVQLVVSGSRLCSCSLCNYNSGGIWSQIFVFFYFHAIIEIELLVAKCVLGRLVVCELLIWVMFVR